MILNMWSIDYKYLDQAKKTDKERNEIHTCMLDLE